MSFMRLDGIQGASREKGFVGWFGIDSATLGVHRGGGSFSSGGTRPSAQTGLEEFVFTTTDKTVQPRLMQYAAAGRSIARGEFVLAMQSDAGWKPAFRIDFENAHVSSIQMTPAGLGQFGASFTLHALKHRITHFG